MDRNHEDTVPTKRRLPKPGSLTGNPRVEPSGPAHIRVTVDGRSGGPSLQINLSRTDADVDLSSDWLILVSHYLRARFAFKSDLEMAQKLGLDRTRLIAWKKGAAVPRQEHVRFLADVATTVDALRRILHPAVVTSWLTAPKFDLGDRTPIEMLREGRLPEVLQSVNATEHGAYV